LAFTSQAAIYKWIDNRGNVHFSDTPKEGAEKIQLPELQLYSTPKEVQQPLLKEASKPKQSINYTSLSIIRPKNQATIRNNTGFIAVSVKLEPALAEGDSLQLYLDGKAYGKQQRSPLFSLQQIDRGEHSIVVKVLRGEKIVASSEEVIIYLHRPRVGMSQRGVIVTPSPR